MGNTSSRPWPSIAPFEVAGREGDLDLFNLLIAIAQELHTGNVCNRLYHAFLKQAALAGHIKVVQKLLKDPYSNQNLPLNVVNVALRREDVDMMKVFCESGQVAWDIAHEVEYLILNAMEFQPMFEYILSQSPCLMCPGLNVSRIVYDALDFRQFDQIQTLLDQEAARNKFSYELLEYYLEHPEEHGFEFEDMRTLLHTLYIEKHWGVLAHIVGVQTQSLNCGENTGVVVPCKCKRVNVPSTIYPNWR